MASLFRDAGIRQTFNSINGIIRFKFDIIIHSHIPINLSLSSWKIGSGNNLIIEGEFTDILSQRPPVVSQRPPVVSAKHLIPFQSQPPHRHSSDSDHPPSEQTQDQQTKHPSQLH